MCKLEKKLAKCESWYGSNSTDEDGDGVPDRQAECEASAQESYDEKVAECPPPSCGELAQAAYDAAVAECEGVADPDACEAGLQSELDDALAICDCESDARDDLAEALSDCSDSDSDVELNCKIEAFEAFAAANEECTPEEEPEDPVDMA